MVANKDFYFTLIFFWTICRAQFCQVSFQICDLHSVASVATEKFYGNKASINLYVAADLK